MGVRADIFTRAGAGTPDLWDDVTIVEAFGEEVVGPFEPDKHAPAVMIELKVYSFGERVRALYVERVDGKKWRPVKRSDAVGPMFNGRFIWASDGRVRALSEYPIPLHDRWETAEEYASYD